MKTFSPLDELMTNTHDSRMDLIRGIFAGVLVIIMNGKSDCLLIIYYPI